MLVRKFKALSTRMHFPKIMVFIGKKINVLRPRDCVLQKTDTITIQFLSIEPKSMKGLLTHPKAVSPFLGKI